MAVVPRRPNPCPGRAYPRTSLLFRANQTGPGYTLTCPPSRDKAARGSPGTRGSSQLLTCSHAKPNSSRAQQAPCCRVLLQQEEQQSPAGALGPSPAPQQPRAQPRRSAVAACVAAPWEQLCQGAAATPAPSAREGRAGRAAAGARHHPAPSLPGSGCRPRHGFRRRLLNLTSCSAA